MYKNKRILAMIPARGGSKGVKRKNIRSVAGRPLIAWTIKEARKSKYIDRLILSSDDKDIIAVARKFNCEVPFIRPAELALDNVTAIKPALHALETLKERFDYLVLLQPTSPLRTVEDIDGCIKKCISSGAFACASVTISEKSPCWMYSLDSKEKLKPIIKQKKTVLLRQQLKSVYALNGAVYIVYINWFKKNKKFISDETIAYPMPKTRSVDIDTEWDLRICDVFLSDKKKLKF